MSALTPSTTRSLLQQLGIRPKKKLGQNFLIDPNIARKSVEMANVEKHDLIVEVGPGLGTLTQCLLDCGATVYAVEKDIQLYDYLSRNEPFKTIADKKQFFLLHGDAMEYPLAGFTENTRIVANDSMTVRGISFKIVANLPYSISSPWLEAVLNFSSLPVSMTLMVQKEAARRYVAEPGTKAYGAISIFLQSAFDCKIAHPVSPKCFYPEPAVSSVLLSLKCKSNPFRFSPQTRVLIRKIFQHRRKQLAYFSSRDDRLKSWLNALAENNIKPTERAENLKISDFQMLQSQIL